MSSCKELAQCEKDKICATFDLQQVIHLPISNENALFYKRRLANCNLLFYDIADGACNCFTRHEALSKRGSSEIATEVYMGLKAHDAKDGWMPGTKQK
ncbi:tRNA uridine 5-carboxymethylaminomethyl modification enzyme mnmg [Plakobranchus ocellatus]|uniref:tRNA uridine 5-carboxymethylaminomethyl modification enzyme mnmg n=1 Tax=Plakobranchus ocellatus TaxID=259542 RepID=A0AAV4DGT7_9GAST|nr:tRNA uridine 5-carboxymethylaminomethyl modification enzyme mnmg [Plakobranchus ocellatus]